MPPKPTNHNIRKWSLRVLGSLLALVLLLLLTVTLLLNTQWGNNIIKNYAQNWLQKKLQTELTLGKLTIDGLSHISLENVLLKDKQRDTIAGIDTLDLQMDLSGIFGKSIVLNDIKLAGLTSHLYSQPTDSNFNYQFIIDAFASGDPSTSTPASSEDKPWKIDFKNLDLSRIHFDWNDQYLGDRYTVNLQQLTLPIYATDLDALKFQLKNGQIDGLDTKVVLGGKPSAPSSDTATVPFFISADSLTLTNTHFELQYPSEGMHVLTNAGRLSATKISYDLPTSLAKAGLLVLNDHQTDLQYRSAPAAKTAVSTAAPAAPSSIFTNAFSLVLDSLSMDRNDITVNDAATKPLPASQFDATHMALQQLLLKAGSVTYDSTGFAGNIRQLAFTDKNGFELKQLQANAHLTDHLLTLNNFVLTTRSNHLAGNAAMHFASMEAITEKPASTRVDVQLLPSTIRLDELAYFAPSLSQNAQLKNLVHQDIKLNLLATGTLDDLQVKNYRIQTGVSVISGSARVLHPMDMNRLDAQLSFNEISSSQAALKALLPKGMMPESAWGYIPDKFTLKGSLNGNLNSLKPDMHLISNWGNLWVKGFINNPTDEHRARYDLTLETDGFALNKMMKDTSLGLFAGKVHAAGIGFIPDEMKSDIEAWVNRADYNKYAYHDVQLVSNINRGDITGRIQSNDNNLDLDADASLTFKNKLQNIKLKGDIRRADLLALGFMDSVFLVAGKVDIDMPVFDSAIIIGDALVENLKLAIGAKKFSLDTVSLTATHLTDIQTIKLHSPLADLELKGKYSLQAIPSNIETIMHNWLATTGEQKRYTNPVFGLLRGQIHIADSLAPLIPGLKKISPFNITSLFDTHKNQLVFSAAINQIVYEDYTIDTLRMGILELDNDSLYKVPSFQVELKKLSSPSISLNRSEMSGTINRGTITTTLNLYNEADSLKYRVPATYVNDPHVPYVFLQNQVMLNQYEWKVNQGNRINLDPEHLQGSNLMLQRGDEYISVNANTDHPNGYPLTVGLHNFRLQSLTGMVLGTSSLITGVTNGQLRLHQTSPMAFDTDLAIDSFVLIGQPVGNLHTKMDMVMDGPMNVDLSLTEAGNNVKVNGNYNMKSGAINMQAAMHPFRLTPFGFLGGMYVDEFAGNLTGDMTISGTTQNPDLHGTIGLDSTYMIYKQLGMPLFVNNAKVQFNGQQINFQGMQVADSAGRPAFVTGTATAEHLTDINYNLNIRSPKFMVAGKHRYEDQLISGPLYAGLNMNIAGNLDEAEITGNANVLDSSFITYVYRPDVDAANGEGLIEFFDPNKKTDTINLKVDSAQLKKASSTGFHYSVNTYVSITPSSSVVIVLDELTGDQILARGNANFNYSQSPSGEMELIGNYIVESGTYNLTIGGLIKKTFDLQKGSSIVWSGDVMKATTDLTALYKVKTDPSPLINDGTATESSKQKLDFEVYLMIKGPMMKPDISFRLDMPTSAQSALGGSVYTRIKQINTIPSELNKQVMGVLALNNFIADNPFSSLMGGGGNMETTAFSTAGKLLTQELNDFLGSVVKSVDISVGLDIRDDYTSGAAKRRSDLNVGFAKSFAHNRLKVFVGNTLALENDKQQSDLLSGLASDVTLEYQLTSDGRYRLKGYRQTTESLTFNGTVVETGVTFVVVVEFNKYKNAFRSKKRQAADTK